MSAESNDARLPEPLRTVTPPSRTSPNAGMDAIGWGIAICLAVLLVPLLPILAGVWGFSKGIDAMGPS